MEKLGELTNVRCAFIAIDLSRKWLINKCANRGTPTNKTRAILCQALLLQKGRSNDYSERKYSIGETPVGEAPSILLNQRMMI